ncbi:biotin/lipoyl-containing protein [Mucilaginibacter antarcticus]|uniref:Biotin/lipoyl-containing protein n=1 Tax=Mucilaginibacter antarcticus TaxID=1855725 RepID=A0ABW5XPG6_9SPHI
MYQIKVNDKFSYTVDNDGEGLLMNNGLIDADVSKVGPATWHIIDQLKSYNVELVNLDQITKTATIRVNNNTYQVTAKDKFDILLDKMGLSGLATAKISELKAPMPGLVLKTFVEDGTTVRKGESLFILEAMKMENIIKSPSDGIIRSVKIKPGDKVEKGQILLMFV